ncbi:hypothetical protein D3C80_20600 [compost metagenome]
MMRVGAEETSRRFICKCRHDLAAFLFCGVGGVGLSLVYHHIRAVQVCLAHGEPVFHFGR